MKKKLLVLGVVVIALLGFSGVASSSVYMQYWDTMNSEGWIYYGELVPGYTFYGKYNYVDHMLWKEYEGINIWTPTHENWHINVDTKTLYKGKPCLILHYNMMWHVEFTPKKDTLKYMGYLHLTDPAAADPTTQWYIWYLIPAITKIKWGKGHPTIEDTTTLTDFIFENVDFTLIPLIDRIEFGSVSISVSLL
jgi:hypothetical protein